MSFLASLPTSKYTLLEAPWYVFNLAVIEAESNFYLEKSMTESQEMVYAFYI